MFAAKAKAVPVVDGDASPVQIRPLLDLLARLERSVGACSHCLPHRRARTRLRPCVCVRAQGRSQLSRCSALRSAWSRRREAPRPSRPRG